MSSDVVADSERCAVCGGLNIVDHIKESYSYSVCHGCRELDPERFRLLTKTQAKQLYLLTDEELRDASALPHVSKRNPKKSDWSDMQLFLHEQVRAFALRKWGSEDALKDEIAKRAQDHKKRKTRRFEDALSYLRKRTKSSHNPPIPSLPKPKPPEKDDARFEYEEI